MPLLVGPALAAGSLRKLEQPRLGVDGQLALRPWRADDDAVVRAAFACPDIQRWHVRRIDSDDEARTWIAGWAERWADETDASWAFDTVGLNRLFLQHSTANPGSCRVAGKAGFGLEGTLRRSMLHADGWHDVHLHARLRTDADCPPNRHGPPAGTRPASPSAPWWT
jgi:ribosomal-protein-alanine N-acetyltransferase